MGGSSSINGMAYVRGNKWDYDNWTVQGNKGWSYEDVLPYFIKSEHNENINDAYHGQGGPLNVENPTSPSTLNEIFLKSCEQHGIPRNPDFNGKDTFGCAIVQRTTNNGERCSAAKAFLTPHLDRPNLTVITGALTEKILIEESTATYGCEIP